jgi:hypothetical protein
VWNRIRDRVLAFVGPSILSHEMLGLSAEDHVARIAASLQYARVRVVVMARGLAATLPSLWQEKVKMADPSISWPGKQARWPQKACADGAAGAAARPASSLARSLLGAASSAANHHSRAVAVGDAVLDDRAEEHAHELTVAVTPDDDEISGLR